MALPKNPIIKIIAIHKDGNKEVFSAKQPMIIIEAQEFEKLSQFYKNYSNIIKSIRDDKSINALCELQRGQNAD